MVAALTVLAGLALLVAGICLAIFFRTSSEPWGRANDATVAAWAILMIPAALEISSRYDDRSWLAAAATVLAITGEVAIGATSGLTAAGRLDWRRSAKIGAVGFIAFGVWMGAASTMAFLWGGLPEGLVSFGIVAIALAVAAAALAVRFASSGGSAEAWRPPHATTAVWVLAFLCIPAWCIWLGISL